MKKITIMSLSLLLIILCLLASCGVSDSGSNNPTEIRSSDNSTQAETKASQKETEETISYNREEIEATILGYCESMDTQDYEEFKKYRPDFDDEGKSALFDTILKSQVIEIEFDKLKKTDENKIEVPVKYEITYSMDYIPVGSRDVGKNTIYEIFTLEEKDDIYIITEMVDSYLK